MRTESANRPLLCDLRYIRVERTMNSMSNFEPMPVFRIRIHPDMDGLPMAQVEIDANDAAAFADELCAAAYLIRAALKYDEEKRNSPVNEI
jgi:hypothetical protein